MTELIPPADIAGRICAAGTCERKAAKVPRVAQAAVSLAPVQNFARLFLYILLLI